MAAPSINALQSVPAMGGVPPQGIPSMPPGSVPPPSPGAAPPGASGMPSPGLAPLPGQGSSSPIQITRPNLKPLPIVPEQDARPDIPLPLSKKARQELGQMLREKILHAVNQKRDRDDRIRQWRSQYEAVTYSKNFPWPNSASLNVPVTRSIVDTVTAIIQSAMTDTTPLIRCEGYPGTNAEQARALEMFLNWQAAEQIDLTRVWDEGTLPALRDGTTIFKLAWEKYNKKVRKRSLEPDPDGGTDEGGNPKLSWALTEENDYEVNQPVIDVIDILDFFLYPANAKTIKSAIGVGNRIWKTANDLRQGVADGIYDKAAVSDLLQTIPQGDRDNDESTGGDPGTAANVGLDSAEPYDTADRAYQLFECIWKYSADEDGLQEDCYFVVDINSGILIRAIHYPFWHGERNYFDFTPLRRPQSFYGYSLPEVLEDLQSEVNAIRNQRVDAGSLMNSPVMLVRRGAMRDWNKQRWRPGAKMEVEDPEKDVKILSFQAGNLQSSFAEEQSAREMAEKVTGVSDTAMGASPSRSRPLGETEAMMASGNVKFRIMVERYHRTNNRILQQVLLLDRQYLTDDMEYSLSGQVGMFGEITPEDLTRRVKIACQGNTENGRQQRLEASETLFQMAQVDPLIMHDLAKRWNVDAYRLNAQGITNVIPFIGSEDDAIAKQKALEQQGPPPPEPPSLSGKLDDPATLALAIGEGTITPDSYNQAAELIQKHAAVTAVTKTGVQAAADMAARQHESEMTKDEAEHGAATDMTAGLMGQHLQAKAGPTPPPILPPNGGNAAP